MLATEWNIRMTAFALPLCVHSAGILPTTPLHVVREVTRGVTISRGPTICLPSRLAVLPAVAVVAAVAVAPR